MTAEPFPKPAAGAQGRPQPEHAPGGPPATPSFGRLLAASLRTMLLGFARFVHRGGKPEFFGLTFIDNAALSDIRTRGEEVLFQERAGAFTLPRAFPDTRGDQLEALCEGVERFEAAEGPRMSPSLQMNLLFLREHLVRRRDDGRKLLG